MHLNLVSWLPKKSKLNNYWPIILIIFLGIFFRFYKLNWDHGYSFHPDENNIVSLANSLNPMLIFKSLTKGTFSYGSLIPYLSALIHQLLPAFSLRIILRFFSALSSSCSLIVVYQLGKKFWSKKTALLAVSILAFAPGAIQTAHFGTFESILTLLYLLAFWHSLKLILDKKLTNFYLSLMYLAIAMAIKISSFFFVPISFISLLGHFQKRRHLLIHVLIGSLLVVLLTITLSPYYLTRNFRNLFLYEHELVSGKTIIFYTRQFINTQPILFQLTKILPYLTSPFITIILVPIVIYQTIYETHRWLKKKKLFGFFSKDNLLLLSFTVIFFPNAFLFTKWSRYLVPVLPFLSLLIARQLSSRKIFPIFLVFSSLLFSLAFLSIYQRPDIRITASGWILNNLEPNSRILSESGNVTNFPLPQVNPEKYDNLVVENFNFYDLDLNPFALSQLSDSLVKSQYILVPSRRVFLNHPKNYYPKTACYYQLLFSGKLGYRKIGEFTSYPRLGKIVLPDENAEETWTVFDHPVIRIFKKEIVLTTDEIIGLFTLCLSQ